jgi:hypothetical protein
MVGAIAMVTFSATAYTAARHVAQDHGIGFFLRVFFTLFLVVCGTGTIVFSVYSTLNVSYEQFSAKQKSSVAATLSTDATVAVGTARLDDKSRQIANLDAEITGYETASAQFFSDMNKPIPISDDPEDAVVLARTHDRAVALRNYTRVQAQLVTARDKRDKMYSEKDALRQNDDIIKKNTIAGQASAYSMVAAKLGISEDDMRFGIFAIPAVFFDIIAPFAMAIVMLLVDRRKGIEKISFIDRVTDKITNKLLRRL